MSDVTRILPQIEEGEPRAAVQLLPLIDDDLRKLAAAKLVQESLGQLAEDDPTAAAVVKRHFFAGLDEISENFRISALDWRLARIRVV